MYLSSIWLCSGLALALPAFAAAPGAAHPAAGVSAAPYESVFAGYRSYRDPPLADWRSINEDVAAAGGHLGIMRGAAKPPTAAGSQRVPETGQAPALRGTGDAPAGAHRH